MIDSKGEGAIKEKDKRVAKPLETFFEVVFRFSRKEQADICKEDIEANFDYSAEEVREVVK